MPDWAVMPVSRVAAVNPKEPPLDAGAPFITMADVDEWGEWARTSGPRGNRGGARARGGDTLMARITPCLENGKIAKVPSDIDRVGGSTELIVLRAGDHLLPDFLFLWAASAETHTAAVGLMTGTTGRQRVSGQDIGSLPIALPSIPEQRRIVDLIAALDAQCAALDEECQRIDDLHNALREDLLRNYPETDLGSLLLGIEAGKSPSTSGEAPGSSQPGVLKVSAVAPLEFRASEAKVLDDKTVMPANMEVKEGDILITRANTPERVGAVCRVPPGTRRGLYLCDKTLRLLPKEGVDEDFLAQALNRVAVRAHLVGSATGTSASMYNISQPKIRATPIPSVPIHVQRAVAWQLNGARHLAASMRQENERLRALRAVCLSALLSKDFQVPESYDQLLSAPI